MLQAALLLTALSKADVETDGNLIHHRICVNCF